MDKRSLVFAAVALLASALCVVLSGFKELSWTGLALTIGGAVDFLFQNWTSEGRVDSEVYGEAGEEAGSFAVFS